MSETESTFPEGPNGPHLEGKQIPEWVNIPTMGALTDTRAGTRVLVSHPETKRVILGTLCDPNVADSEHHFTVTPLFDLAMHAPVNHGVATMFDFRQTTISRPGTAEDIPTDDDPEVIDTDIMLFNLFKQEKRQSELLQNPTFQLPPRVLDRLDAEDRNMWSLAQPQRLAAEVPTLSISEYVVQKESEDQAYSKHQKLIRQHGSIFDHFGGGYCLVFNFVGVATGFTAETDVRPIAERLGVLCSKLIRHVDHSTMGANHMVDSVLRPLTTVEQKEAHTRSIKWVDQDMLRLLATALNLSIPVYVPYMNNHGPAKPTAVLLPEGQIFQEEADAAAFPLFEIPGMLNSGETTGGVYRSNHWKSVGKPDDWSDMSLVQRLDRAEQIVGSSDKPLLDLPRDPEDEGKELAHDSQSPGQGVVDDIGAAPPAGQGDEAKLRAPGDGAPQGPSPTHWPTVSQMAMRHLNTTIHSAIEGTTSWHGPQKLVFEEAMTSTGTAILSKLQSDAQEEDIDVDILWKASLLIAQRHHHSPNSSLPTQTVRDRMKGPHHLNQWMGLVRQILVTDLATMMQLMAPDQQAVIQELRDQIAELKEQIGSPGGPPEVAQTEEAKLRRARSHLKKQLTASNSSTNPLRQIYRSAMIAIIDQSVVAEGVELPAFIARIKSSQEKMPNSTPPGDRPYQCTQCPSTFKRKCDLTRHEIAKGHADRPSSWSCQDCPQLKFADEPALTRHIADEHADPPSQEECFLCPGRKFGSPQALQMHCLDKHPDQPDSATPIKDNVGSLRAEITTLTGQVSQLAQAVQSYASQQRNGSGSTSWRAQVECKFGAKCRFKDTCSFKHPGTSGKAKGKQGKGPTGKSNGKKGKGLCHQHVKSNGKGCSRRGSCSYAHPTPPKATDSATKKHLWQELVTAVKKGQHELAKYYRGQYATYKGGGDSQQ